MYGYGRVQNGLRQGGFSLLELTVAMAIAAILLAIAVPAYLEQSQKARRADAHASLLKIAAKQEKYYAVQGSYTPDLTKLGFAASTVPTEHGYYTVVATVAADGQSYLITATRQAPQDDDAFCGDLTYSSLGVRSAINNEAADPGRDCW